MALSRGRDPYAPVQDGNGFTVEVFLDLADAQRNGPYGSLGSVAHVATVVGGVSARSKDGESSSDSLQIGDARPGTPTQRRDLLR
jgi:hypothetical protein